MSRYELLLRASFSAAHQLRLPDGTMEPMHGHNWKVEAYLEGPELDSVGILADFTVLQPQLEAITAGLHNTLLNDLSAFSSDNPSTERIAKYVHDALSPRLPGGIRISKVRIWETDHCAAAFVP